MNKSHAKFSANAALFAILAAVVPGVATGEPTVALTAPAQGAVLPAAGRLEKIPLVAFVEIPGMHDYFMGGPWVRFTITCAEGPGSIVREPSLGTLPIVRVEVTVGELLDLAPGRPAGQELHVRWKVDAGGQKKQDTVKFLFGTASGAFALAGAANLALSMDGEFGSPWPTSVVVRNAGGTKSQPSSLEVTFRLRDASDPAVRNKCPALDYHKVHTVLALAPNGKSAFALPKPQGGLPAKPSGGVHRIVTCNYGLDAALTHDTNRLDPNAGNDRLQKTVSLEIPLESK